MRVLIIYDSYFSNTRRIASAIASGFSPSNPITLLKVNQVKPSIISSFDVMIVGSPTRGFRPTKAITELLKSLPAKGLQTIAVAAFDTRINLSSIGSSTLRYVVDKGGYAAKHIDKLLIKKGGIQLLPPEGFYVNGEKGPLPMKETERARIWGKELQSLSI